jgi:hypothetical protein
LHVQFIAAVSNGAAPDIRNQGVQARGHETYQDQSLYRKQKQEHGWRSAVSILTMEQPRFLGIRKSLKMLLKSKVAHLRDNVTWMEAYGCESLVLRGESNDRKPRGTGCVMGTRYPTTWSGKRNN